MSRTVKLVSAFAAVIFTITVVGLLVWGIYNHTEPGFLTGCWKQGVFHFTDAGGKEVCDEVVEPQWPFDQLPITVQLSGSTDRGAEAIVARQVEALNDRLGFKLLSTVATGGDIEVLWNAPYVAGGHSPSGSCKLTRAEGKGYHGEIVIRGMHSVGAYAHVVYHELGHCGLLLAHDDFASSPMSDTQQNVDAARGPRLTDYDRDIIRERYRRQ